MTADTLRDGDAVCFGKVAAVFQVGSSPRLPAVASSHASHSSSMPAASPACSEPASKTSPAAAQTATPQAGKPKFTSMLSSLSDDDEAGGSGSDTECEEEVIVVSTVKTSPSASALDTKAGGATTNASGGSPGISAAPSPFQAALSPVGSPLGTQAEGGSDTECEEEIVETEPATAASKAPEEATIARGLAEEDEDEVGEGRSKHEVKEQVEEASPAEAISANEEMVTQRQGDSNDDDEGRDPTSVPTPMTAEKLPDAGNVRFDDAATQAYEPLEPTEEDGDDVEAEMKNGEEGEKRGEEAGDVDETQAFGMGTEDDEDNGGDATQVGLFKLRP